MSETDNRSVGDETVLYIAPTPSGYKVEYRNGEGLADGFYSKGYTRYFTGEKPLQKAKKYAKRKADEYDDYRVLLAPPINDD